MSGKKYSTDNPEDVVVGDGGGDVVDVGDGCHEDDMKILLFPNGHASDEGMRLLFHQRKGCVYTNRFKSYRKPCTIIDHLTSIYLVQDSNGEVSGNEEVTMVKRHSDSAY